MSGSVAGKTGRVARFFFLIYCLFSVLYLGAQANPAPPVGEPSKVLLFRIRAAFSLTPAMIHFLQTKNTDSGTISGSAAESSRAVLWGDTLERNLPFAAPLDVRLVGKNVVALIQIVPIELRAAIIDLIIQGQVWVKMPDDSLSFKTTVQTLSLPLGSRLYFYPLGVDTKTGAPIAVEIRVDIQPSP